MNNIFIRLRLNDMVLSYNDAHRSLLNVLMANQIPVEYQCCSGYCGVCRLRLLDGKVKYHKEPLAFIGPGEILSCCCFPVNDIELEL